MHEEQKLAARDKVALKMTRDGAVEQNLAKKSTRRVSKRVEDATLVKKEPQMSEAADLAARESARKKRRAQRIRDADEVKNPEWSADKWKPTDEQENVEKLTKETDSSLHEESVREKCLSVTDHVVNRLKKKKKQLYEEARRQKKTRLAFDSEGTGENTGSNRFVGASSFVSGKAFNQVRSRVDTNEDENSAVDAMHAGERIVEAGVRRTSFRKNTNHHTPSGKMADEKASRLRFTQEETGKESTKVAMKRQQKKRLGRSYASGWRATQAGMAAQATEGVGTSAVKPSLVMRFKNGVKAVFARHPGGVVAVISVVMAIVMLVSVMGTLGSMVSEAGTAIVRTTYLAVDDEMIAVEDRYKELEAALQRQIDGIETAYPGYDEYRYQVDEIYHNPYHLISYFTTVYGAFKYEDVKDEVEEIFREQYGLDITGETVTVTETKTVGVGESLGPVVTSGYCNCPICCGIWSGGSTASGAYPTSNHTIAVDARNPFVPMGTKVIMNGLEYTVEDTGNFAGYGVQFDVYYDSHAEASSHGHKTWEAYLADENSGTTVEVTTTRTIKRLSTVLKDNNLDQILRERMNEDQIEQYEIYNGCYGNRQDLFGTTGFQTSDGMSYDIPPEALTDRRFRNMITEAEKYLGYPYVWGGASPSTSFDCSGFVSWVINNCGNGWSYGRLTADGLRRACTFVSPSEAKPGDLIFFQGTYNTSGASHVGIYVGNGMMIHCGNPIQYASIETSYWQQHFYCFGRLP